MRWLQEQGHQLGRHRVRPRMGLLGLEAAYTQPKLSQPGQGHRLYPCWLSGGGFVYLVAVMDWFSRFVLLPLSRRNFRRNIKNDFKKLAKKLFISLYPP